MDLLHAASYSRNPEPIWRQLRDDHPLYYDAPTQTWVLSRYDDCVAVFADHETYSAATYEESTGQVLGPTLISRDDHEHVVLRSIVAPDFVGNRLAAFRPLIESAATTLIERIPEHGSVDLVAALTANLPVDVIAAMLGMEGDGAVFRDWVTAMIQGLKPAKREAGLAAKAAFCRHIEPALAGVDSPERTDLIAKIARAEAEGRSLTTEEITAFCGLLFIAGGETTDKAMANMWWHLLCDPELLAEVAQDRSLLDAAFSETMRRCAPVVSEDRFTTTTVEWYGTEIPAGARVRAMLGAANLDETVFVDPERFDPHRSDLHLGKELRSGASVGGRTGHLGFGLGKHFCIGYELARTEAIIGSEILLDRRGVPAIAPGATPHPEIAGSFRAVCPLDVVFG